MDTRCPNPDLDKLYRLWAPWSDDDDDNEDNHDKEDTKTTTARKTTMKTTTTKIFRRKMTKTDNPPSQKKVKIQTKKDIYLNGEFQSL